MGFRGQNTKLTDNAGNGIDGIGKNNVYGVIQGGYGMRYGDFNVGPYAFYLLGTTTTTEHAGTFQSQVKWKNQWGIGFQPGYFLSKDTVVYLKVGYNGTTLEVNQAGGLAPTNSRSTSFGGPGVGLGLKHQLSTNWVIFVDAQQQYYSTKTLTSGGYSVQVQPKMTMGTFGFGYQF